MMCGNNDHRGLKLDPRTKVLLVFSIATVVIGGGGGGIMNTVKILFAAVPMLLFLTARKWRPACIYAGLCAFAFCGRIWLVPATTGFLNFMLVAFCGIFAGFMPGVAMGSYLVNTTTVSEFMAAMGRMHIGQKISIPLSVMFRFFPTISEESGAITDAMRLRGIRFGGGKPGKMLEYRMVPLMMSCVKIGDELSAAALTRGLGAPVQRTNICRIGFGFPDFCGIVLCIVGLCCFVLEKLSLI